jgi:hypothetical protein
MTNDVGQKVLKFKAYKLKLLQRVQENDLQQQYDYAANILSE